MKNLAIFALVLFSNGYIFAQISTGIKPLPNKAVETQKAIYLNTIDPAVMDISFKTIFKKKHRRYFKGYRHH